MHEGSFVGQKDLLEMQDCAPSWRSEGDLRKPEAQAAARMSTAIENRNSKLENRRLARLARGSEGPAGVFAFRFSNREVKHGTHCGG